MIDTIRICGPGKNYKFDYDWEQYTGFRRKDGTHYVPMVQVSKKKNFRAAYNPAYDLLTVEFNPHKVMFTHNIYNYEDNIAVLSDFIRGICRTFFDGDCYISRIDLGGVKTFEDNTKAVRALEGFRNTRPNGARVANYQQQNYEDSVFYKYRYCSIKIYNKGKEMGLQQGDSLAMQIPFELCDTLRFEKTYRFRYFEKRLRMKVEARKGVHIDNFRFADVYDDFLGTFLRWEYESQPYHATLKSSAGLLQVLDAAGLLSKVEAQRIVHRSTIKRYKDKKREAVADDVDFHPVIDFQKNMTQKVLKSWNFYKTFGLTSAL